MSWPDDPREAARRLAKKLAALPETAMRRAVVGEELVVAPAEIVVATLHELFILAREERRPPYTVAQMALAAALSDADTIAYAARAELYAAAKLEGHDEVARLFFAAGPGTISQPKEPDPEQVLEPRGRPLTLGERKSLARGGRRELLARLLRDPDAAVIKILLDNPRLTERDVVFVAARRPVRGEVLRAIFESRWLARRNVRRALVLNPYTPGDLAVRILPTLDSTDRREVAADPNLSDAVREQARLLR